MIEQITTDNSIAFDPESPNGIGDTVCIWGTTQLALGVKDTLSAKGIEVACFIDNDPYMVGQTINGTDVLPPCDNPNIHNYPIIICNNYYSEIFKQLYNTETKDIYIHKAFCGRLKSPSYEPFHKENMIITSELLETVAPIISSNHDQLEDEESRATYLAAIKTRRYDDYTFTRRSHYPKYKHSLCKPRPGDVIINAGGYNGQTTKSFHRMLLGEGKVIVFEPSPIAQKTIEKTLAAYGIDPDFYTIEPFALWDKKDTLRLLTEEKCDPGAFISSTEMKEQSSLVEHECPCITLDSYLEANPLPSIDLIKMDIESAEQKALAGAARTIRKHKPRLQIAIYHKASDLWEIQKMIAEMNDNYAFFVGHHAYHWTEVILYAIDRDELRGLEG